MGVLVDTDAVPPGERFEFWQAASSELLMPYRIRRSNEQPFWGRISGYALGALKVFRVESYTSVVLRTGEGIRASDPEWLGFAVHLRGETTVAQGDRATSLRVGDFTTLDSSRPFSIDNREPVEWLVFMVPKQLLRSQIDRVCRQTATLIPRSEGLGRLASPFLCELGDSLAGGHVLADDVNLGESVLALIRGLFVERGVPDGGKQKGRALLLLRVKRFIEERLGNPSLGPEQVARAHFISTRQLNRLFEAEGLSVCEWIREQRLDRCRRDLGDPALVDEGVLTIAARWGFRSQPHFSRLFRAAYGCSPREYRREPRPAHEQLLLAERVSGRADGQA